MRSVPSALAAQVAAGKPAVAHALMLAAIDDALHDLANMLDGVAPAQVRKGENDAEST